LGGVALTHTTSASPKGQAALGGIACPWESAPRAPRSTWTLLDNPRLGYLSAPVEKRACFRGEASPRNTAYVVKGCPIMSGYVIDTVYNAYAVSFSIIFCLHKVHNKIMVSQSQNSQSPKYSRNCGLCVSCGKYNLTYSTIIKTLPKVFVVVVV